MVVHGDDVGLKLTPTDGLVLGRVEGIGALKDAAVAERHAKLSLEHGQWVVHDLGDVRGTWVNDHPVTEYALRDGDRIRIGRTILKLLSSGDLATRYTEEMFRVSQTDGLTLATSRVAFEELLARDVSRARRFEQPLSLVLLDVDGFRALNATRGEAIGDAVLQKVTHAIRHQLRRQDVLARIGDDEFGITLPEVRQQEAAAIAEKLKSAVAAVILPTERGDVRVTVSAGVVTLRPGEEARDLANRALDGIERAQKQGGNTIERDADALPSGVEGVREKGPSTFL